MKEDPIVAEVRRHREARARRFKCDIKAIARDARKRERKGAKKVVSLAHETTKR
jgi:hypothetical protein